MKDRDKSVEEVLAASSHFLPSQQIFFNEDSRTGNFTMSVGGTTTAEFGRENAERLGIVNAAEAQKKLKPSAPVVCPVCGNEVTTRAFCPECGTRLFCPGCGSRVGQTRFCPECGTKLD